MSAQEEYDIYKQIVEGDHRSKDIVVETKYGDLNFQMNALDRHTRYHYLSQVNFGSVDVPEDEVDEDGNLSAEAMNDIGSNPQGSLVPDENTVAAFEGLVIASLSHDELVEDEIAEIVRSRNFDDGTLFELGGEIVDFSMDMSDVTGFRSV